MRVTSRVRPGSSREYVGGTRAGSAIVVGVCGWAPWPAKRRRRRPRVGRRPGTRGVGPGGTTHDKTIEIEGDEEELREGATRLRVG
ncbi:DUF167 domain-containing protein [Microbispora bryophytorum]|nr:DUF167 domain-containing protein [Microbispora bryophytorum]